MFDVDVKGLDALRKINGVGARKAINDAAKGVGAAAVSQASLLAPVDTGHLRSSINYAVSTGNVDADEIAVGSKVKYAPFQELGARAHWPPVGALAVWAKRHGTTDFLARRAIAEHGIEAKKFLWGAIFPEFRQTVFNHIIQQFVGQYWESVGK